MAYSCSKNTRSSSIMGSRGFAFSLISLILSVVVIMSVTTKASPAETDATMMEMQLGNRRPCDEIYVVGEGETLHTISDKCGDPFILERNPHIYDPDDVFPGLVIRILPSRNL
ncbi:hypothetical protein ACH5RR_017061 [Cinchona calisaya]|uniref:LysM domain-containing protein n=1 Tax=Cinchona calisaya TaxID=153742 RepID=A0ABD3A0E5_9GENT